MKEKPEETEGIKVTKYKISKYRNKRKIMFGR